MSLIIQELCNNYAMQSFLRVFYITISTYQYLLHCKNTKYFRHRLTNESTHATYKIILKPFRTIENVIFTIFGAHDEYVIDACHYVITIF